MIQTKRCSLIALSKDSKKDIYRLFTNKTTRLYLGGPRSLEGMEKIWKEMLNENSASYYWTVHIKSSDSFLGVISISPHHHKDELEISYQFLPEWWGQGLATEVIQAVIHFAFEQQLATRLLAETQIANTASCRVLEKVGMFPVMEIERFGARQRIYKIESPHMPRQNKKDD